MAVKTANLIASGSPQQVFVNGLGANQFNNTSGTPTEPISTLIENEDPTNAVRLGPASTVSSSSGLLLPASSTLPWDWVDTDMTSLYMVAVAGTPAISVIATRQNI